MSDDEDEFEDDEEGPFLRDCTTCHLPVCPNCLVCHHCDNKKKHTPDTDDE